MKGFLKINQHYIHLFAGLPRFKWSNSGTSLRHVIPRPTNHFPPHSFIYSNSHLPSPYVLRPNSSHKIHTQRKNLLKRLLPNLHRRRCIRHVSHHPGKHLHPLSMDTRFHASHPLPLARLTPPRRHESKHTQLQQTPLFK